MLRKLAQRAKQAAARKLFERQLRDLPERERELLLRLIEKHPDLFESMAKEIKEKIDNGIDQFTAMASVMQKYRQELMRAVESLDEDNEDASHT